MFKKTRLYINMKYFYYYFLSELKYLFSKHKLEYKLGKKNIFLFMTADYGNLGDVAITLSEINFLKEYFPEYQLIEVPLSYSYNELRFIKKNIKENDIVAIVGGGNMTNRYESFEIIRRTICRKLVNCRFVFFPQTVDYTSDNAGNKSKKQMIHCLNKISKKLIAVREKNSFNYLKNEVSALYLVQDIVMYNIGKRISDKVNSFRKKLEQTSSDDTLDILDKVPYCLLKWPLMPFLLWMDRHDKLPGSIYNELLYNSTYIVSNLGSIKCGAIHHNLTDLGTSSIIITIGDIHKEVVVNKDGKQEVRDIVEFGINLDERIADGAYMAKSVNLLNYIMTHPETLDEPMKTQYEGKDYFTYE